MTAESWTLLVTFVVALPLGYLLLASPAFLFVRLSIPTVTRLLRIMFNGYYLTVAVIATIATLVHFGTGHWLSAVALASLAAFAYFGRRWFLARLDCAISARDAGNEAAVPYMRRLHLGGMAVNAVQLGVVLIGLNRLI